MDEGSPVDIIYLDFEKAVDKVPHQRLKLKLKSHGMGKSIINWIERWLTDRRLRVVVEGMFQILETSFELGTTRICTRAYLVFNIHVHQ